MSFVLQMNYIEEFITLAETLNFSKTAELTYVTQPVLSRHIAKLEEEMGIKLLERTTRTISLTSAGQATYESFRKVSLEVAMLREQLAYLSREKTGTLKVVSADYLVEDFVEPWLEMFSAENPLVNVQIMSTPPDNHFSILNSGEADISISAFFPNLGEDYRRVSFAQDRLAIICHKRHPLAAKEKVFIEDLDGEEIVTLGAEESFFSPGNDHVLKLLQVHNVFPRVFHYSSNAESLGMTLKRVNGVAVLPYSLRHMDRAYLAVRPLENEDCKVEICMYYRTDNNNSLVPVFVSSAMKIMQ